MMIVSGAVFMGPPPATPAAGVSSFKNEKSRTIISAQYSIM